jgi:ubiquinone/menaquinone biosynthesis C-methylase UbiE
MTSDTRQTGAFLDKEGDAWFERNRSALENRTGHFECDLIASELEAHRDSINSILEIGCGDGRKTQWLARFFGASAAGVDPSRKAIEHGRQQLAAAQAGIDLRTGTADRLEWPDSSFDLVYFGFCLYLVGRTELLAAVTQADRVLRPGGFLVILDFDPRHPHRREYHHRPGLFSYKQDYAALFTASAGYHLFAKRSFSHAGHHFAADPAERVAMSFLYKENDPYPLSPATKGTR